MAIRGELLLDTHELFRALSSRSIHRIVGITSGRHIYTAIAYSVSGAMMTAIWFVNNVRMHQYVRYWWERTGEIEEEFQVSEKRSLVRDYEKIRKDKGRAHRFGRYSWWVNAVPAVFLGGWFWMLGWSLASLCRYLHTELP